MAYFIITLVVLFSISLLLCFKGNKLFYPVLTLTYFVTGMQFGLGLFDSTITAILVGLAFAVIFALLTKFIYKASLALAGVVFGLFIAHIIVMQVPSITPTLSYVIYGIMALITAILLASKSDLIIILNTSFTGASLFAVLVVFLVNNYNRLIYYVSEQGISPLLKLSDSLKASLVSENTWLLSIITICMFIIGVIVQKKDLKNS